MLLYLYIQLYGISFVVFHKRIMFLSFIFLIKYKFPQQNINQSQAEIADKEMSVELYAKQTYFF